MHRHGLRTTVISVVLVAALVLCVPLSLDERTDNVSEAASGESVLRLGYLQQIDSLNPYIGLNDVSYVFYGLVYDALTCVGNDLETLPNLAKSWWAVPNNTDGDPRLVGMPYGSVWQYNLSTDAYWTDGEPFTADDVIYTVWLNSDPANYDSMWAYQPNSYYMHEAWKLDSHTVRVSFWDRSTGDPMPASYAYLLSIPILPKHLLEQLPGGASGIGFNWTGVFPESLSPGMPIVGTGPFMATPNIYTEWYAGNNITLVRNPNCHWAADYGKLIKFDKLVLNFYQDSTALYLALLNSQIDAATLPPTAYDALKFDIGSGTVHNITAFDGPKISQYFTEIAFCMNEAGPNPSRLDPVIRQALHIATNKQYIVDNMYLGLGDPGSTLIPPVNSYWHYEPTPSERFGYNLTAAAALLESNGYVDIDSDGIRECTIISPAVQNGWVDENTELRYEMLVRKEYPEEKDIAQFLKSQWQNIGVVVTFMVVEEMTLAQIVYSYNYDAAIWCWSADLDPNYILFTQTRMAWSGWSDTKYYNPAFDSNYTMSVETLDPGQRKTYVDNCQKIHYLDSPYIILAYPDQTYAWRDDTFTGWGDWSSNPGRSLDNFWTGNQLFFDLEPIGGTLLNSIPILDSLSVDPNPVLPGADADFTVVARDYDADSLNITVDFGDGEFSSASGTNTTGFQTVSLQHSYDSSGIYDVTVWVDDGYPGAGHNVTRFYSGRVLVGPGYLLEATVTPSSVVMPVGDRLMLRADLTWDGTALESSGIVYMWNVSNWDLGSFEYRARRYTNFTAGATPGDGAISCWMRYYEIDEEILVDLTVLPPVLDQVVVVPTTKTMLCNATVMFSALAYDTIGHPINGVSFSWTVGGLALGEYSLDSSVGSSVNFTGYMEGVARLNATATVGSVTKSGSCNITLVWSFGPRSVSYDWYDMFNVPFGEWWDTRWPIYMQEYVLSDSYPYTFRWYGPPSGHRVDYTNMRLSVAARNLTEVNMNSWPEFLPLLGAERGGNAAIDWYMQYLTLDELETRYPSFASQNDGWIICLNGTVSLDEQAAKAVLNMTDFCFDNFAVWWASNQAVVVDRYADWLVDEAEDRLDIENAFESYFQLFTFGLTAMRVGDEIVLTYDLVTWGMEALMMRWLHEAFMPTEWWYEGMDFHAAIGPDLADIDIDTVVDYAMFADQTTLIPSGDTEGEPCWTWHAMLGDSVPPTIAHPHSDIEPYLPYEYITHSPVSTHYGQYIPYDYTPGCWNLSEHDTMRFQWPAGDVLFRYHTGPGTAVNISDEMTVQYSEPMSTDLPGQVSVDSLNRTIEFQGPVDMWNWSRTQTAHTFLADEWSRLGGDMLPYGQPLLEFKAKNKVNLTLGSLSIEMADSVPAGDLVTFEVTAYDQYGLLYDDFIGAVNFTSSDPLAVLPANYTFLLSDQGSHTFVGGATFWTEGSQCLLATNVSPGLTLIGNKSLTVVPKREADSMQVGVYHTPAVGVAEDVTVTVLDQYGDVFVNYTGTVTFFSNRSGDVTLPTDYVFALGDAGVHTITGGLTFQDIGWFSIIAEDVVFLSVNGTQTDICVLAAPEVIDHFTVSGIKNTLTLRKSDVLVTAYNQYGTVFERYTGTIHFSANASGGVFPADYAFQESDLGYKEFTKGAYFTSPGVYTVTVADIDTPTATGSQTNIVISLRPPSETFRMYDMFQERWGEWWPWRYKGYKNDIILTNETGKYTMIYNLKSDGLQGIIYAPYRWNIDAVNMSQVCVHEPEFMPVLGTPDVAGANATVDIYFQYLDWNWWNSYWKPYWNMPDSIMSAQVTDGYYPGVTYTVTMNRQAAEEWLGMPQAATPLTWWVIHGGDYLDAWRDWISYEGNNRLDIWPAYEWPYVDLATKMKLQVLPDGKIRLIVGHIGEGFEILMTRWLSETNLCHHEAWYEDMSVHIDYYSDWIDFDFDAVCQYSLHAVKANESATNEPAWAWEPLLIDYVASWNTPGGAHPSTYDPWDGLTYQSWNAGDPSFMEEVYYDSGVNYFNLSDYQTFIIQLPIGDDNIGFDAEIMPWDAIRRIIIPSPPYDKYPLGNGTNYDYSAYWPIMMNGTMTLGWYGNWTGAPNLDSCYDPVWNTITMLGPMSFENSHHDNGALYHGAPWIEFNVTAGLDLVPPFAVAIASPNPASVADLVTLNGSMSWDMVGTIVDYNWTFVYNGAPYEFHAPDVQFMFAIPGTYQISLTCTDGAGNSNTTTVELEVSALIPEFHSLSVVVVCFVAMALLISRSRRKMK